MITIKTIALSTALVASAHARGPRPNQLGAIKQPVGYQAVVWYTTWDSALAEAKRSNRPIFYMSAAAQCGTISGTF